MFQWSTLDLVLNGIIVSVLSSLVSLHKGYLENSKVVKMSCFQVKGVVSPVKQKDTSWGEYQEASCNGWLTVLQKIKHLC